MGEVRSLHRVPNVLMKGLAQRDAGQRVAQSIARICHFEGFSVADEVKARAGSNGMADMVVHNFRGFNNAQLVVVPTRFVSDLTSYNMELEEAAAIATEFSIAYGALMYGHHRTKRSFGQFRGSRRAELWPQGEVQQHHITPYRFAGAVALFPEGRPDMLDIEAVGRPPLMDIAGLANPLPVHEARQLHGLLKP